MMVCTCVVMKDATNNVGQTVGAAARGFMRSLSYDSHTIGSEATAAAERQQRQHCVLTRRGVPKDRQSPQHMHQHDADRKSDNVTLIQLQMIFGHENCGATCSSNCTQFKSALLTAQ
jgi:hypothetical protein